MQKFSDFLSQECYDRYAQGYFLMADDAGKLTWYTSAVHALLPLDGTLHVSKSMRKALRQGQFDFKINTAVKAVIDGCRNRTETWISEELADIYMHLHAAGLVHTFEAWQGESLAGGVVGLAIGGAFIGESMFSAQTNGSKAALVGLTEHLQTRGFTLFDAQVMSPHLERFGAYPMPRRKYVELLARAAQVDCTFA